MTIFSTLDFIYKFSKLISRIISLSSRHCFFIHFFIINFIFTKRLTDFQAGLILTGASAGIGALISLIPGIGWTITLNIVNAVITFAASHSVKNGIKISYRSGKYLRIYSQ